MREKIWNNREKIFNCCIIILYIIITGIGVLNHEAYEDEAQSWLIARDLSFSGIISQMKYEGHSFLWYFLIAPFAKLGMPMQVQSFISWFFCIASVILILKKAPFNKLIKLTFIFSSGLLYFYSIIARPYCMIPLFLILIAIIYPSRDKHPYKYAILLSLLANTHLIMLPTVFILALMFWGKKILNKSKEENRKDIYLSLIILIIGVGIYISIAIAAIFNCKIVEAQNNYKLINNFSDVIYMLKSTSLRFINFLYGMNPPHYILGAVIISLILCVIAWIFDVEQGTIFFIQLICNIILHSFSWFLLMSRVCVIFYSLLFWLWNSSYKKDKTKSSILVSIASCILVIVSIFSTFTLLYKDVNDNFSTGKEVANYIDKNLQPGTKIFCLDSELQQSIIGYLKKDKYHFYMLKTNKEVTFTTWDDDWLNYDTDEEKIEKLNGLLKEQDKVYVLISGYAEYIDLLNKFDYDVLIDTSGKIIDSMYVRNEIYKLVEIRREEV